jgi:DNA-binding NtrC family response regulator
MAAMCAYDWPGNIRSLENTLERLVLLSTGPYITIHDLPARLQGPSPAMTPPSAPQAAPASPELPEAGTDLFQMVEQYENHLIRQALSRTGGNKNRAAQLLNLNRTTLVEMIKRKKL